LNFNVYSNSELQFDVSKSNNLAITFSNLEGIQTFDFRLQISSQNNKRELNYILSDPFNIYFSTKQNAYVILPRLYNLEVTSDGNDGLLVSWYYVQGKSDLPFRALITVDCETCGNLQKIASYSAEQDSGFHDETITSTNSISGTITVSIKSVLCDGDCNDKEIFDDNSLYKTVTDLCVNPDKITYGLICKSCKSYNGVSYIYSSEIDLVINFSAKKCVSTSPLLSVQLDSSTFTSSDPISDNTFSLIFTKTATELKEKNQMDLELNVLYYNTEVERNVNEIPIKYCFVKDVTNFAAYDSDDLFSENASIIIPFSTVSDLYSECFDSNARYSITYYTKLTIDNPSSITIDARNEDSQSFNLENLVAGSYSYVIRATDVFSNTFDVTFGNFTICSSFTDQISPLFPFNGSTNATVENALFKWKEFSDKSASLRCTREDSAFIFLELESESDYMFQYGPQTSVGYISNLHISEFRLLSQLLSLSTRYYWRLTVFTKSKGKIQRFSSNVMTFITVPKHCAYISCKNGLCDSDSLTCSCFEGYRGEFCDISGLTALQYAGISIGIGFLTIIILGIVFVYLKRKYFSGLRIPDLSLYMFSMPKNISEDDSSIPIDKVISLISSDNDFSKAISLLECTPVTDLDSVCRALMYCFEKEGKSLSFLLSLISYEVDRSDTSSTLFRNNSFASKCFKVYGRMIGLPYLFRVIFPLINKLYKEDQKSTIEVHGEESLSSSQSSANYELNLENSNNDISYEASIDENALLIQLACETFFNSLNKNNSYCPNEFKQICRTLESKVHIKYPDYSVDLCIAPFIFLRFFVAGISVPESFGIIKERPEPLMRRRLILISKVLSNMSTHVKFGDKEDYMIVMNDYLESKQPVFDKYYRFLCSNSNNLTSPVIVPEKYYGASLNVLSYAFAKQNSGEWVNEELCESTSTVNKQTITPQQYNYNEPQTNYNSIQNSDYIQQNTYQQNNYYYQ